MTKDDSSVNTGQTERPTGATYYLVEARALPDVFLRVMRAKELIASGESRSVNEAVQSVGISRSAYYKYRDAILPFYETSRGSVITLVFAIENLPGVLAAITTQLAAGGANVLTIHQGLPVHGLADVSVAIETEGLTMEVGQLLAALERVAGVHSCQMLARTLPQSPQRQQREKQGEVAGR
ncbi:MAG: ACT domain-containing protein [Bacillota bacterium]|nr:ACT domain-containing protein [Bacillota bacterium]